MSDAKPFSIEPLGDHDRTAFRSGVAPLDRYLHEQVGQDERRGTTRCYVLCQHGSNVVNGYYTLSALSAEPTELPASLRRRLSPYLPIPLILLGRLAVAIELQGQGVGTLLLYSAFQRVLETSQVIGVVGLVVDASDDNASQFYLRRRFIASPTLPQRLFLPLATIRETLALTSL